MKLLVLALGCMCELTVGPNFYQHNIEKFKHPNVFPNYFELLFQLIH